MISEEKWANWFPNGRSSNFIKFTVKDQQWSYSQMLFCEFCETFQNSFFPKYLGVSVSESVLWAGYRKLPFLILTKLFPFFSEILKFWKSFFKGAFFEAFHCVKSVRIQSYSGPYFSTFELNTERYGASLRIQSKCGKI